MKYFYGFNSGMKVQNVFNWAGQSFSISSKTVDSQRQSWTQLVVLLCNCENTVTSCPNRVLDALLHQCSQLHLALVCWDFVISVGLLYFGAKMLNWSQGELMPTEGMLDTTENVFLPRTLFAWMGPRKSRKTTLPYTKLIIWSIWSLSLSLSNRPVPYKDELSWRQDERQRDQEHVASIRGSGNFELPSTADVLAWLVWFGSL